MIERGGTPNPRPSRSSALRGSEEFEMTPTTSPTTSNAKNFVDLAARMAIPVDEAMNQVERIINELGRASADSAAERPDVPSRHATAATPR